MTVWQKNIAIFGVLFLKLCSLLFAQSQQLYGTLVDSKDQRPIPFAVITTEWGTQYLSGIDGTFHINAAQKIDYITIQTPYYLTKTAAVLADTMTFSLQKKQIQPLKETNETTQRLVKNILENRFLHNPHELQGLRYQTYNKTYITTDDSQKAKKQLTKNFSFLFSKDSSTQVQRNWLQKINRFFYTIQHFNKPHHFFLMETHSETLFKNSRNRKETILAAKVSGLKKATALNALSQVAPFSVYDNYLRIGTDIFVSPLAGNPFKRYHFSIENIVKIGEDSFYVVRFEPHRLKPIDKLEGFMLVHQKDKAIVAFYAIPVNNNDWGTRFAQQLFWQDGYWLPQESRTDFYMANTGLKEVPLLVVSRNYFSALRADTILSDTHFLEKVIYHIPTEADEKGTPDYWKKNRGLRLSEKDSNTYTLYDSLGSFQQFKRVLQASKQLYFGQIPVSWWGIDYNKFLMANGLEGFRPGLRLITNNRFSRRSQVAAYAGFGLGDAAWKYRLDGSYFIIPQQLQISFQVEEDVAEPGFFEFAFNKKQYNIENVRSLSFLSLDRYQKQQMALNWFPHPYISLQLNTLHTLKQPTYDYAFGENQLRNFHITETSLALRYSYGANFFKVYDEKISAGTQYPEVWLQVSEAYPSHLIAQRIEGNHSYTRFDGKMQYNTRWLGLGKAGFQLIGGKIFNTNVPYPLLYTMKGSYRAYSIVANNSFETMRYNEFAGHQYVALFYAHYFGRLYFGSKIFQPSLQMMNNAGWSKLEKEPENLHQFLQLQDIRHGYFESGFYFTDLFVMYIAGIKLGAGAGLFLRYGAYQLPQTQDNLAFKLAVSWIFDDLYLHR